MGATTDDIGQLLFKNFATESACELIWLLVREVRSEFLHLRAGKRVLAEIVKTFHDVIGYHLTNYF